MQVVTVYEGVVMDVRRSPFQHVQRGEDGLYDFACDTFGESCVPPDHILILPDEVEAGVGDVVPETWHAQSMPMEAFLRATPEQAAADALGLVLRQGVAEGAITDGEILRVAPAQAERAWHAGIEVQTGDVYHFRDALWRCVQAHTTQAGWEPDKTAALWRRVEITGEGKLRVWASQTDYEKGDLVAYPEDASPTYRCRLAHTSQDGWEPPRVPALWEPDDKQGGQ